MKNKVYVVDVYVPEFGLGTMIRMKYTRHKLKTSIEPKLVACHLVRNGAEPEEVLADKYWLFSSRTYLKNDLLHTLRTWLNS